MGKTLLQHWTPGESWLFAELARASLLASLDDGPAVRALDGSAFVAAIVASGAEVTLSLTFDADRVALSLAPVPIDDNPWRDAWFLALDVPDGPLALHADSAPVTLALTRGEAVTARLYVQRREVVRALGGGEEVVPVSDAAFHKYTWQSSGFRRIGPYEWSPATDPEPAPEWRIDLGAARYLTAVSFDLAGLAPDATVVLEGFSYTTPDDRAPAGCFARTWSAAEATASPAGASRFFATDGFVARMLRVSITRPEGVPAVLHVTALQAIGAELFAPTLRETLRRAFALHGPRTLVEVAGDDGRYLPSLTYAETWTRAMALARTLAARLEPPVRSDGRVVLAVMTRNRPAWIMADLAALERGYVLVPIAPEDPDARLAAILALALPDAVVCEPENLSRVRSLGAGRGLRCVVVVGETSPPSPLSLKGDGELETLCFHGDFVDAPSSLPLSLQGEGAGGVRSPTLPPDDALYSVLFTSGSTGAPKGAMRSYAGFLAMVRGFSAGQASRHLSFQPLSHLSERMHLPWLLVHGVTLAFSRGGAHLFEELRAFGSTHVASVPRLFDALYGLWQQRVRALERDAPEVPVAAHEALALRECRARFGENLLGVSVGSAPVSPEVLAFVRRCFAGLWVSEGYGSTEVGTITHDGTIATRVEVKLVPVEGAPDAGDGVERGEILVRSPDAITGYLGDAAATRAAFDDEGFFRTGDLGARDADGTVRVIGRLRNTVKLAQGEFVSIERVEGALASAPLVESVFVHARPGTDAVVALVVPRQEALASLLGAPADMPLAALCARDDAAPLALATLRAHGRRAALAAWELPRAMLLDPSPFTPEDGRLTASGKLCRPALTARHGAALDALSTTPTAGLAAPEDTLLARVTAIASRVVGRPVSAHEPLGLVGGDSLAAAEILAGVGATLGREVPLARWFEARDLDDLVARIGLFSSGSAGSSAAARVADDLALALAACASPAAQRPLATVLLTGATGFLGAHLLEALVTRAGLRVVCLVRAADDGEARARLASVLATYEIPVSLGEAVGALAGDLASERLGLAPEAWASLAASVDAVVHCGAEVSWLASYERLRRPNVLGTHTLLGLALAAGGIPVHFVSTISTTRSHGDEATMLTAREALASSPYGLSKWVAESLVRRAGEAGLPVAIYRPSMIAAHSLRGHGNPDDFIHRYLVGAAALGLALDLDTQRFDMTPVDFVAEAIAALVVAHPRGGATWHLTHIDGAPTWRALGLALGRLGVRVTLAPYETFRAALLASPASRLAALAAYFPEEGFGMAMGPWPHARSAEELRALGVHPPTIDDALLGRTLAALRACGALPRA